MGRRMSAHRWFYGVFGADTPFCVLVMLSNAKNLLKLHADTTAVYV